MRAMMAGVQVGAKGGERLAGRKETVAVAVAAGKVDVRKGKDDRGLH